MQAGTLSGNPLAMTAGLKTLEILDRPGAYEHLEKVTGRLIEGILQAGRDAGHAVTGGHISGKLRISSTGSAQTVCVGCKYANCLLACRIAFFCALIAQQGYRITNLHALCTSS